MFVDPVEAVMKSSSSLLVSSDASASPTVSPIPTVVPGPSRSYEKAGTAGVTTLWVVFVLMLLSTVAFTWMAFKVPVQKRLFHVLTAFITTFATISYYAMASGDGISWAHAVIKETHQHTGVDTVTHVYRQIYWARYVDWSLTTPLLLLDLSFLAGLNGANILVAVVADLAMVLLGLFADFGHSDGQKWGYYGMSCLAYLVIIYQLAIPGRRAVLSRDNKTSKLFASIAGYTLVLWTLYPIIWGIGDGGRKMSVDAGIIAYAVLDLLAKPVFGFWLLLAHSKNVATLEGFWSHGLSTEGSVRLDDEDH